MLSSMVNEELLARAFSPPNLSWHLSWGVAPGYDNAGLQPAESLVAPVLERCPRLG